MTYYSKAAWKTRGGVTARKRIKDQGEKPTITEFAAYLVETVLLLNYHYANKRSFPLARIRLTESTRTLREQSKMCD